MTDDQWRVLKALAKHGPCDAKTVGERAAPEGVKRPADWVRGRLSALFTQGYVSRGTPTGARGPVLWKLTRDGSRALKQWRKR